MNEILIIIGLILLNGVFSMSEVAMISARKSRLSTDAKKGSKAAQKALDLSGNPDKFLSTVQIGITLIGILTGIYSGNQIAVDLTELLKSFGLAQSTAFVVAQGGIVVLVTYLTIVFGELVPKRIAMQDAEKVGLSMSGLLYVTAKTFAPLVWLLTVSTNGVLRLLGIPPETKDEKVTEEEIRIMVDAGSESGTIDDIEQKLIHNVFEFDDKLVEEVMTHRTEVAFLNAEEELAAWERKMIDTRHSVYPVFRGNTDHVVGALSIKDYFKYKNYGRETVLAEAVKPAQFVPETQHIDDLFQNMKKSRNHFAVVVDEYGGVDGIVTMKDLLKELVGDLEDDFSQPPAAPEVEQIGDNRWHIRGSADIDEAAAALGVSLPADECDTFGGFVLSLMSSIPENKTNIELVYQDMRIRVVRAEGHKIEDTIVWFDKKTTEDEAAEEN